MKNAMIALSAAMALASFTTHATQQPALPKSDFGELDHVFLIIMENQAHTDILGSPSAPFINSYAKIANQATDYFAVGHPARRTTSKSQADPISACPTIIGRTGSVPVA